MTCDFALAQPSTASYSFVYPISLTWLGSTRGMVFQALSKTYIYCINMKRKMKKRKEILNYNTHTHTQTQRESYKKYSSTHILNAEKLKSYLK